MVTEDVAFRCRVVRTLRRRDFDGDHVSTTISGKGITLRGEGRGFLYLPFERVARMRVGLTRTKYGPIYETSVWLDGEREPLRFFPYDRTDERGYSAAIRTLAGALAARGKLGRIERGVSVFDALVGPALLVPVILFALAGAAVSADPPVWWHFVVIPFLPTVAFGIVAWYAVTRHLPRAVRSLNELDVHLPVNA